MWNLPDVTQEIRGILKGHPKFVAAAQPEMPDDHNVNRIADILDHGGNGRCKSTPPSLGD
jgi:hypothetical protein